MGEMMFLIIPESLHRKTNTAQTLDSTEKEKISTEPMGATTIFSFPVKPISCTLFRVSMQGFGYYHKPLANKKHER